MNFKKVELIILSAFMALFFGNICQLHAADQNYKGKSSKSMSRAIKSTGLSSSILLSKYKTSVVPPQNRPVTINDHILNKSYKNRRIIGSSHIVGAILDYDDYTQIFKFLENKE